jgi:predicted metallopeptidase
MSKKRDSLRSGDEYKEIARKLVDKYPVAFGHLELDKMLFLVETERTPKDKYADVKRVRKPYTYMTECKFIMRFYEGNIVGMNDAQKIMLVYHELMHIDPDFNKLRKHNVQDFLEIVEKYGANWDVDPNLPNLLEDDEDNPPIGLTESEKEVGMDDEDLEPEPELAPEI